MIIVVCFVRHIFFCGLREVLCSIEIGNFKGQIWTTGLFFRRVFLRCAKKDPGKISLFSCKSVFIFCFKCLVHALAHGFWYYVQLQLIFRNSTIFFVSVLLEFFLLTTCQSGQCLQKIMHCLQLLKTIFARPMPVVVFGLLL